jgi:hypothetical protein
MGVALLSACASDWCLFLVDKFNHYVKKLRPALRVSLGHVRPKGDPVLSLIAYNNVSLWTWRRCQQLCLGVLKSLPTGYVIFSVVASNDADCICWPSVSSVGCASRSISCTGRKQWQDSRRRIQYINIFVKVTERRWWGTCVTMALRTDWPKYVMTSVFLCWRSTVEKIVYIFLEDLSKRIHCPADFSYEKLAMRYRDLCVWCMMEVLIKSYQTKWVILGQELTEDNLRK